MPEENQCPFEKRLEGKGGLRVWVIQHKRETIVSAILRLAIVLLLLVACAGEPEKWYLEINAQSGDNWVTRSWVRTRGEWTGGANVPDGLAETYVRVTFVDSTTSISLDGELFQVARLVREGEYRASLCDTVGLRVEADSLRAVQRDIQGRTKASQDYTAWVTQPVPRGMTQAAWMAERERLWSEYNQFRVHETVDAERLEAVEYCLDAPPLVVFRRLPTRPEMDGT